MLMLLGLQCALAQTVNRGPAPEFSSDKAQDWLNSDPLRMAQLRGRVVLLDVWTYSCHNCYRSIPWLLELEKKFSTADFVIVGIHTPEFNHEHDRRNVARKLKQFAIKHPVMMDNDFAYWKRLKNRYWPSFYLIDKTGHIKGYYIGETHSGSSQARQIENHLKKLLDEPSPVHSPTDAPKTPTGDSGTPKATQTDDTDAPETSQADGSDAPEISQTDGTDAPETSQAIGSDAPKATQTGVPDYPSQRTKLSLEQPD